MGMRRRARETALQLLFQYEFGPKISPELMLARFCEDFAVSSDEKAYAGAMFLGICENMEAINGTIEKNSAHWKVARMALVDINVMRIAVFEVLYGATPVPPNVAINEAVEIAKNYGTTDSGSFVNGILDQTFRSASVAR